MSQVHKCDSNNMIVQLFRYFWVGGFAFLLDYVTLFLFTEYVGVDYLLSAAIAFTLGLVANYLLSIAWVFHDSRLNNKKAEFVIFAVIGLVGLVLNEFVMYICSDFLNIHYMVSKLCSTGIVFFWNFFGRKYILFTKQKK